LSVDERIANVKRRIESVRLASARAEVGKESADKEYEAAQTLLREQFGVDNPEQVRDKLVELKNDLDAKLAQIEEILKEHKL
jgi:hypothetical protein